MIKYADFDDIPEIYRMLVAFGESAQFPLYHGEADKHALSVTYDRIQNVIQNGIALVSIRNDLGELNGMLLAVLCDDHWKPGSKFVHELAWWVDPEYRRGTTGYRLLAAYQEICEDMMRRNVIEYYNISTLTESPVSSLRKRGWQPLQTTWKRGL